MVAIFGMLTHSIGIRMASKQVWSRIKNLFTYLCDELSPPPHQFFFCVLPIKSKDQVIFTSNLWWIHWYSHPLTYLYFASTTISSIRFAIGIHWVYVLHVTCYMCPSTNTNKHSLTHTRAWLEPYESTRSVRAYMSPHRPVKKRDYSVSFLSDTCIKIYTCRM